MITFLIIVLVLYLIFGNKKDKHNPKKDAIALSKIPAFTVNAKPMGGFTKFLNLAYSSSQILKRFSYSQERVEILLESGDCISADLAALSVVFEKTKGLVTYYVYYQKQKISFYQTTNISNKEWDAISSVLCLAGETQGRDIFSNFTKYSGYVSSAIKAINHLS